MIAGTVCGRSENKPRHQREDEEETTSGGKNDTGTRGLVKVTLNLNTAEGQQ